MQELTKEEFGEKVKNLQVCKKVILDGKNLCTVKDLFAEFSRAFLFPPYFGNNWNAFDECICDLDWLKFDSIAIFIKNYDCVLQDCNKSEKEIFEELMSDAIKFWTNDFELDKPWGHKALFFEVFYTR